MASASPKPLPYDGVEHERLQRLGAAYEQLGYFQDVAANGIRYRFNPQGFRSADFDPAAASTIFAFGDSHTFGVGLDYEAVWPTRFAAHWRQARGLPSEVVCLQNFADAGASNASIARVVVTQCSAIRPDVAIVKFAPFRRTEGLADGKPFHLGWWTLAKKSLAPGAGGALADEWRTRARGYFDFANDEACALETLRCMLLVQYFCRASGIRLVASSAQIQPLAELCARLPVLAKLWSLLDRSVLCDFDIWTTPGQTPVGAAERSSDGAHAGAGQHDAFAQALLQFANAGER